MSLLEYLGVHPWCGADFLEVDIDLELSQGLGVYRNPNGSLERVSCWVRHWQYTLIRGWIRFWNSQLLMSIIIGLRIDLQSLALSSICPLIVLLLRPRPLLVTCLVVVVPFRRPFLVDSLRSTVDCIHRRPLVVIVVVVLLAVIILVVALVVAALVVVVTLVSVVVLLAIVLHLVPDAPSRPVSLIVSAIHLLNSY